MIIHVNAKHKANKVIKIISLQVVEPTYVEEVPFHFEVSHVCVCFEMKRIVPRLNFWIASYDI